MNVTPFYLFIGIILLSVFAFFKPLHVQIEAPKELAQIELNDFIVHEINPRGVKTILGGTHAQRFEDRYVVDDINLTDRSEQHIENMRADFGVYKASMITLDDHIRFTRDDGIVFEADHATYDLNKSIVRVPGPFVMWQDQDKIKGQDLIYNSKSGDISAKRVKGLYGIKELM